ncbi:hypothetical protein B0T17DRAFT_51070 [Bombardia bombarda]|uniref:Uncharacterized protein n=1 Tax=Bombardia bombarda TaxID=252184 RepID=A0AA40CFP4_9PEZI|nr:hypothetical protein B0T17DRAFT_51070 [Bombardia bombarda]
MASSTMTFAKKKSRLSSFVTRRTDVELLQPGPAAEHALPELDHQEQSTIRFVPYDADIPAFVSSTNNHRRPTIDEMVDDLLDDMNGATDDKVSTDGTAHHTMGNHPNIYRDHPVIYRSMSQRCSPQIPRRSSKRNHRGTVRHRRGSPSHGGSAAGSTRRLPRSKTGAINPLGMNPTKLVASSSMPLTKSSEKEDISPSASVDALQITHKVDMMLAATKALKPAPEATSIPPSSTVSKVSRLVKRTGLFRKVSNALADRLNSKSHSKNTQQTQNTRNPDGVSSETQQPLTVPDRKSPATSLEIQVNEGKNLDPDRVKKVVGSRVQRKSMTRSLASRRDRRSYSDPFSEPSSANRPPTEFENRLRTSSAADSIIPMIPVSNPFESENVWGSNHDSFLPSAPIGSSTPRIRVDDPETRRDSPTKKSRSRRDSRAWGSVPNTASSDANIPLRDQFEDELVNPHFSDNELSKVNSRDKHLKIPGSLPYIPVMDNFEWKKHPSPAKGDLAMMMKEFRTAYPNVPLGPVAAFDTTDELACSTVTPQVINYASASSNKNRAASSCSSKCDDDNEHSELLSDKENGTEKHSVGQKKKSRRNSVFGNPLGITRSQTESRFTFRRFPRRMELDELQLDVAPLKCAYTPLGSQEVY